MKTININLSGIDYINIYTFSDLHIGDKSCNYNKIYKMIDKVSKDRNGYVIINGDIMNNALVSSVSDVYTEQLSPMKQLELAIEMFNPIKERIICINNGNHERRTYKQTSIELMKIFADELNCGKYYCDISGVLFIKFGNNKTNGKRCYTLYVTHGSGGGKKPGSKVNRVEDLSNIIDCDIYIHSHTHLPFCMKENFFRCINNRGCISQVEKLFVNTNAFLDYGGYGEQYSYTPSNITVPIITLNGNKREMRCEL